MGTARSASFSCLGCYARNCHAFAKPLSEATPVHKNSTRQGVNLSQTMLCFVLSFGRSELHYVESFLQICEQNVFANTLVLHDLSSEFALPSLL